MTTFQELQRNFLDAYNEQKAKEKEYIEKAMKAKKAALRYQKIAARKMTEYHKLYGKSFISDVHWTDLLKSLLKEVQERTNLNFYDYAEREGMSVFGLRCECPVFAHNEAGECIASLCFTPGNVNECEIFVDTGEKKGTYEKGTLGEINGMNNVARKVEDIDTVIDVLRNKYPELKL